MSITRWTPPSHQRVQSCTNATTLRSIHIASPCGVYGRSREFQFWTVGGDDSKRCTAGLQNDRRCSARPNNSKYGLRAPLCGDSDGLRSPYPRHIVPRRNTAVCPLCPLFPPTIPPDNQMYGFDFRLNPAAQNYSIFLHSIVQCPFPLPRPTTTGSHLSPILAAEVLLL